MVVPDDDEVLRSLADGKSMNYSQWPDMFPRLITRLEKIIQDVFPPPKQQPAPQLPSSPPSSGSSHDKENAPPPATTTTTTTTTTTDDSDASSSSLPPLLQSLHDSIFSTLKILFSTNPPHTIQRLAELILDPKQHYRSLAAYLHALDRVVHVTSGAHIFPLPPAIPDPSSLSVLANGAGISNVKAERVSWGNPAPPGASSAAAVGLGSDESLGGALLTPISWLSAPRSSGRSRSPLDGEVKTESTEMIEGPNGPGGIETVSVSVNGVSSTTTVGSAGVGSSADSDMAGLRAEGGITQGELLRQEQKAGVVPAAQLGVSMAGSDGLGEEDELPHARGPEEIGMEDMGPQAGGSSTEMAVGAGMRGIDIEAAVGRKIEVENEDEEANREDEVKDGEMSETPGTPKREADVAMESDEKKRVKSNECGEASSAEEADVDADTDTAIVDADGKTAAESEMGDDGETKGVDAVDTKTEV
ncbi:hypothetical protein LZ554_008547 [Drepanopeziza brunnea f. sp. 'monogermtubi']|nr:hypothetical protein LZ554_008547 [Drepanopeziza brunnea f. sp. 'monogermtubi']